MNESSDDAYVREFMDHGAWYRTSLNLLSTTAELWEAALRRRGGVAHYEAEGGRHADIAAVPSHVESSQPYVHEPVILLVAGYAVEAAVKAVLVRKLPAEKLLRTDTEPTKPKGWFTRHDLNALFDRADIQRSLEERVFLDKLKAFIEWAGRYPATRGGTRNLSLTTLSKADIDLVLAMCNSAWKQYRAVESHAPPPSG